MGKGGSTPQPVDPYQAAQAQYQYGTAAANYNMGLNAVNQVTPYGSTTWSANPAGVPGSQPTANPVATGPGSAPAGGSQGYMASAAGQSPTGSLYSQATAPGSMGSETGPVNTGPGGTAGGANSGQSGQIPYYQPPQYTETQTLSPQEQQILGQQQTLQTGIGANAPTAAQNVTSGIANNPQPELPGEQGDAYMPTGYNPNIQSGVNTGNVPGIIGQYGPGGLQQSYQGATNTALAGNMAAISPALNAQYEQLDASLRNSGNQPGTPAYNTAMSQFMAGEGNEETQAAGAAENTGINLQNTLYGESANTNNQLYGQDLQSMLAGNQAQGQSYGEANTNLEDLYNNAGLALNQYGEAQQLPLQTAEGIAQFTTPTMPSGTPQPSASTSAPDLMSAFQNNYQQQLNAYNASVGQSNQTMSDLGSLGALAYLAYSNVPEAALAAG
jgi:hypothetical protein